MTDSGLLPGPARTARLASYLLAAGFLTLVGVAVLPADALRLGALPGGPSSGRDGFLASVPVFVLATGALWATLVARAVWSDSSADTALAVFATPCLLVSGWGLYESYAVQSGVRWGGLVSFLVGTLLSVVVVADAVVARVSSDL
ncbi:hypothetical protein [Haloarchaeobius sp. HME9146]|uniref:hypothetical protein n=1 Tax=Haloarchaeobius sp. HME9146 TaxID=2978732 RepID=UPI0021BF147F|nr:hypothetical protein [Haloarchaeobius sp. HME9146]MCT9098485.1 hypothetical protein [Haloarchaeobius sp. HME9146]